MLQQLHSTPRVAMTHGTARHWQADLRKLGIIKQEVMIDLNQLIRSVTSIYVP
jgi:hypothetical protein